MTLAFLRQHSNTDKGQTMAKERSFLDPLNEARDLVHECKESLAFYARALHQVGNTKLADDLANIARDLNTANQKVSEGQSMALERIVNGAHQSTANMVNAALAAAQR